MVIKDKPKYTKLKPEIVFLRLLFKNEQLHRENSGLCKIEYKQLMSYLHSITDSLGRKYIYTGFDFKPWDNLVHSDTLSEVEGFALSTGMVETYSDPTRYSLKNIGRLWISQVKRDYFRVLDEEIERVLKKAKIKGPFQNTLEELIKEMDKEIVIDWNLFRKLEDSEAYFIAIHKLRELNILSEKKEGNYELNVDGVSLNPRSMYQLCLYFIRKADAKEYKKAVYDGKICGVKLQGVRIKKQDNRKPL